MMKLLLNREIRLKGGQRVYIKKIAKYCDSCKIVNIFNGKATIMTVDEVLKQFTKYGKHVVGKELQFEKDLEGSYIMTEEHKELNKHDIVSLYSVDGSEALVKIEDEISLYEVPVNKLCYIDRYEKTE